MALIILADDDELIGGIVREKLASRGHIVGVVTNGADALKAVWAKRPQLVILDCNMPEPSGINVLREIRKSLDLYETPVLMLTGRRSQADEDIALYEGANGYLKKPFDPEQLAFKVEELLAKDAAARPMARRV